MARNLLQALLPAARSPRRSARLAVADAVAKGFSNDAVELVKQTLAVNDRELAAALGMSTKSLSRLRRSGRAHLNLVASDRLYRLARTFLLAQEVLENDDSARRWLRAPQVGLGNRVPLELILTEAGAREVEDLLGRMELGVLA